MFETIITRAAGVLAVLGVYAASVVLEEAYHALIAKGKDKRWVLLLIALTFCCSGCMVFAKDLIFR